jgi:hypothetical protein
MSLLEKLVSMPDRASMHQVVRKPESVAGLQPATAHTEQAKALLHTSIFQIDEEHELTAEDIHHLEFATRHGMNVHAREVTALMETFAHSKDTELLRRAIAILKHQISQV